MAGAIQVVWQGAAFAQSWPNLVSLWKLDETDGASFADSGPADVAMAFGGPWADLSSGSLIEGDDGTSAYTGGSGYATIPAGDPDHDLAELTISFYYQRQSAAAKQILLAAGDGTQVGDFSIEVLANGRLRGWHTGEDAELRFFDSFDGIAGTNLAVGTAHRIEVTFGPAGTRIYLDGVPLTHAFILDNHNGWNNARVKHLGRWTDGVLNQAIGVFDGLRLWDRQLTAAQVSTLEPAVATIVGSDGAGVGDTLEVPKAEFLVSDEANPGPITKFVSRQDRGNGSGVSPDHAQELQAALSGASPGQTFLAVCQTPGTIEYWHYPNGLSFPNGSANNPITLQARQGDGIVISKDEEFAGARVPNSGFWTQSGLSPDDISKKIWRSSATFSTGSTVRLYGVWREFAHLHHMLPYASLSDLRATYGTADTPTNYGTPGAVLHTDGRVYIRMQKPHPGKYCVGLKWQSHLWPGHPEAVSGGAKNYPVTEDPNDYPIHLFRRSFGIPAFDLASGASGGWIKIGSGINSCGYERVIRSGHHIVMRRGTDIAWRAFVMDGGSAGQPSNFDVQRRRITNGSLRIAARDEWKFGGWLEGERGAFGLAMDTARDMYFKDCTIAGYHELWVGVSDKLRFRNCVIFDILDDGIQSGSGMSRTEIGYCFILNAAFGGMGQAGAQSDPNPGGWLFHHNIIDARTQKSSDFGKHTTPPFLWLNHSVSPSQPWKNYNNLLFFGPDVEAKQNCGLSHLDNQNNTSGVPHEVFNNIIIRHDTQRYTNELGGGNFGPSDFACKAIKYDGTSNERWDFNLYYRDLPGWSGGGHVDGLIKPHARNGSALEDYNSIALWKASNGFQTSKGLYAPGFENSGSSDRPGLPSLDNFPTDRFKYRPTAQTQVTTATTTSLSGANWWSSPPSWGGSTSPGTMARRRWRRAPGRARSTRTAVYSWSACKTPRTRRSRHGPAKPRRRGARDDRCGRLETRALRSARAGAFKRHRPTARSRGPPPIHRSWRARARCAMVVGCRAVAVEAPRRPPPPGTRQMRSRARGELELMRSLLATLRSSFQPSGTSLRARMVRGAGGTVALKVLNSGLMLLTTVVLARLLGVRGYGAYAYAISWTSLLMIPAIVGLDTLLTREAARYRATDNWPALRGILGWADRIVLAAALTLAAALAVVVWLRHDGLDPLVRDCLLASALLVPFMAVIQLYGGSLRGLGAVIEAQFPFLVLLPMVFLAMLLVLQPVAALTAPAAVALRAASAAVAAVASIWLLHRILPAAVRGATPRYHRQDWLKSAVPFLLLNAAVILNQQVGVLMLGSMVGPEAAGVFDVARRMALLVSFALTAVNMPLAPIVADLHIRRQTERLEAVLVKSARVAAGASCLIAVALIALAPWALRLMGDEFTAGLPVLAILCLGGILGAAAGSVGLALNMTGHERATVKGIGIAACSNLLFNFLLIPHWGILGAALAAAASTALWNVLLLVWVWQHLGLQTSVLGSLGRRRAR